MISRFQNPANDIPKAISLPHAMYDNGTLMAGEYGGWLCACHGSQYDNVGRVRVGPAPDNLAVPAYTFLSDTRVRIG